MGWTTRHPVGTAALVAGLIALVISVASWPSRTYGSDPIAVREEARALLLHGQLAVETPPQALAHPGEYFCVNLNHGRWYSKYGVFGAIASLPPLAAERIWTGELPQRDSRTRVTFLNAWNTALTVATAMMLARLASLYTRRTEGMVGYALACLFATFLWNYARAQSSEIVQVLLAVAGFDAAVRAGREGDLMRTRGTPVTRAVLMWCCWGTLVLTRVYFIVLLPVLWVVPGRRLGRIIGTGGILVSVAALNFVKFGSPFLTGYHQFEAVRHHLTLNPLPGLWGFLVSPEKAVWWHFPLLVFALFAWRRFRREHRLEARWILVGSALYLLPLCTIPSWAGNWSYGPRYLAFGLPIVSLPAVLLWDRGRSRLAGAAMVTVLAVSVGLNLLVNHFEFFVAERLKAPFQAGEVFVKPEGWIDDNDPYSGRAYFDHRPWGLVAWDLWRSGGEAERHPLWAVARDLPEERREAFRRNLARLYEMCNSYWLDRGERGRPPR